MPSVELPVEMPLPAAPQVQPDLRSLGQRLNHAGGQQRTELRQAFDDFVGQTFFSQLISAMRTSTGKPSYFHGGRAEEVFQNQLDQLISDKMAESSAEQWTGPMFELFQLHRR